uniref:Zinc finger, PHD-type n=1 Tax=Tanacetum cinerariifolium TaxID=118510 RepID=A0A6L2LM82_TANCI|nr:zinc finger, PHD-type [Tanacetum cinerariifolium]
MWEKILEHEHPLHLVDLQPNYPVYEEEYDDDDDDDDNGGASAENKLIYHPSHGHPLRAIPEPLLSKCNACRKKHEDKIMIQDATGNAFSHSHPLVLSYSFPIEELVAKFSPRYYVHSRCATSQGNENRKLIKNYVDSDYPDLLHLPFADEGCSLQKHMFSKLVEHGKSEAAGDEGNIKHNFHPHPLILVRTESNDITSTPTSSKTHVLSCHNPLKKVQLLCNACVRPVTSVPFFKCVNDDCNFVLHKWCTQLPTQVKNYPGHRGHTLILHSNAPKKFLSVFYCHACQFHCNGFAYSCVQCDYHIDVTCSFIPPIIAHEAHKELVYMSIVVCYCLVKLGIRQIKSRALLLPLYQCANSMHTTCAPHILQSESASTSSYRYYRGRPYEFVNIKFGGVHKFRGLHPHPLSFVQGIKSDAPCTQRCRDTREHKLILKCQQCKFVIHFECCRRKWRIGSDSDSKRRSDIFVVCFFIFNQTRLEDIDLTQQILDGPFMLNEMFFRLSGSARIGVSGFEVPLDPQWLRCWLMLSPYPFILIMESLHMSFSRAVNEGLFKGIQLHESISISHLFYADDAMFIGEWSDANLKSIVNILKCFFLASGLKINVHKSQVLGVGIPRSLVVQAAASIRCAVMQSQFRYLGVMVGECMSRHKAWTDTMLKLRSRLSNWKVKTLSIGGRLTLLKSVLSASPLYNMSIYKVPRGVLKSMEAIRSRFFNGADYSDKKITWAAWDKVLASKKNGGLGVSSFHALNHAFLLKWVWRFISQDGSLC